MDFKVYFFLFLIYAISGWIIEVIGGIIQNKKFVNRGFMIGPYCPIYGFGGVLITMLLQDYVGNPFVLFCVAIVICGVLEYLTSYIMEKIFKARWWDYSSKKFNINGRVCLETIIPFGLLGCFIMYISNPFIQNLLNKIPQNILNILFYICISLYTIDFIISFYVISGLRRTVTTVNKNRPYDNTEEITKQVKAILSNKGILNRRLINAFPRVSVDKIKQKIKEKTEQVKENVAKAKEEATEKLKISAEKVKEGAEKVKESTLKVKEQTTEKIKESATKVKENTIKMKEETTEKLKEGANKVKESFKKK